jgi:hypothetical protein
MKNLRAQIKLLIFIGSIISASTSAANFEAASELYQQKSYVSAFEAFEVLSEQGDPRAQTVTALMYKFGEGVEQDYVAAYLWYRKAAEQGYPPAQFHTGVMLADGLGVEADRAAAIKWLNIATESGFERAIDKLAELNASAAVLGKATEELPIWSKNWDLRLPDSRLQARSNPRPPASDQIDPTQTYLVQIGATSTQASANRLWEVLSGQHSRLFKGLARRITLNESIERRVYLVSTGPFADIKSAEKFCSRLMASTIQAGCLPVKTQ